MIRDAEPADAIGIAAIGKVAVPETYRDLVDPAALYNIVEQSYSVEALNACIARCRAASDAHFIVAEMDGRIVGFLHYDCIGSALLSQLHQRLATGASYILMVIAANVPAINFYRRHGFVDEAEVDGPTYMSQHMGVTFPNGARPAPALVLRFTRSR